MNTSLYFCVLLLTSFVHLAKAQDDDCEVFKADLVFVLDVSGSVKRPNFNLMIDFVEEIIQGLKIGSDLVRVGLMTFASSTKIEFPLEADITKEKLLGYLPKVNYRAGGTYTEKALDLLKDGMYNGPGNRADVADVVVFFTDGKSNSEKATKAALERIKPENYTIFALAIGADVDMDEINQISSDPDSIYSLQTEFATLANITESFTGSVCESQNPPVPPPKPAKNCGAFVADIVFALDASASMNQEEFGKMLAFVNRIVETLEIGENGTRIGLFTFSTTTSIEFQLSDYRFPTKQGFMDRIRTIHHSKGLTRTDLALDLLPVMFNNSGNRPEVQDIVIVLTDGKSTHQNKTLSSLASLDGKNYTIFSLGIGKNMREEELNAISSDPDTTYSLLVDGFDDLTTIVDAFASQVCEETSEYTA